MTRVLVVSNDKDPPDTDRSDPPTNGLPETLHTWLASGPHNIDALILDLPAPEAAREAVAMVRARGLDLPVILVASEAPGWDAPDLLALSRCVVLPSPVDPQSLRDAVNGLQSADERSRAPLAAVPGRETGQGSCRDEPSSPALWT